MKLESRAAAWCHLVKFAPHRPYGTFLALAEKLVTGVLFVHLIYEKNGENCVNCRQYLLPEHITITFFCYLFFSIGRNVRYRCVTGTYLFI